MIYNVNPFRWRVRSLHHLCYLSFCNEGNSAVSDFDNQFIASSAVATMSMQVQQTSTSRSSLPLRTVRRRSRLTRTRGSPCCRFHLMFPLMFLFFSLFDSVMHFFRYWFKMTPSLSPCPSPRLSPKKLSARSNGRVSLRTLPKLGHPGASSSPLGSSHHVCGQLKPWLHPHLQSKATSWFGECYWWEVFLGFSIPIARTKPGGCICDAKRSQSLRTCNNHG